MSTLKKIDPKSVAAAEESISLFALPPSIAAYNKTQVRELLPLTSIERNGPFTFRLFSDSNFIDFSRTYISLTVSITKRAEDGATYEKLAATEDDKNISVVQNFNLSFIRQLKILINSVQAYDSGVFYPFLRYVEKEFFRSFDSKVGLDFTGLYSSDRNTVEPISQSSPENKGFKHRAKPFAKSAQVTTYGRLEFDLAEQKSLFLPNSDVLFIIYPSSDDFLLLMPPYKKAANGARTVNGSHYRLNLHAIKLYVTLVDVTQSINNQIARHLETTPAKYPLRKREIRTTFMSVGLTTLHQPVWQAVTPRKVLVFFCSRKKFDGHLEHSPFEFVNASVESISVESGGVIVPSTPYRIGFGDEDSSFIRTFYDFMLAIDGEQNDLQLEPAQYKKGGYCGFGFDFRTLQRDLDAFELIKNSTTTVHLQLSKAVEDDGLMLIVYGEFDSILTVDANRVLSFDGSI